MLRWLDSNKIRRRVATNLYAKIVAQARSAAFFRDQGVPDTMEGRFEMIALHVILVLQRLKLEGEPGQRLGQMLMEQLIADMDDALRQIGIGDMGVPRRIQKTAAAFRERAQDYAAALDEQGSGADPNALSLTAAVTRHVFGITPENISATAQAEPAAAVIAGYMRQTLRHQTGIPHASLLAGEITFPDAPTTSTPHQEAR